nr:YigZ family protein [Anaerolineae bacterium]
MTPPRYPIPAGTIRTTLRVANSRFITTVGPAQTVDEAKATIDSIRAEMPDATHHVFGYRIGYGASVTEGMSDDGEPSGTAGRPTLAVLRGADLGDIVLVTTRYFGGTKLGTGGLVRAYTEAAQSALEALPRTERVEKRRGLVEVPYSHYEQIKRAIDTQGGAIISADFAGAVTLEIEFPEDTVQGINNALTELSAGKIHVIWD